MAEEAGMYVDEWTSSSDNNNDDSDYEEEYVHYQRWLIFLSFLIYFLSSLKDYYIETIAIIDYNIHTYAVSFIE